MLSIAFWTLAGAVVLGSMAALLGLLPKTAHVKSWLVGAVHGVLAASGLGLLVLALPGASRGQHTGAASFGLIAAVMMALALLFGLGILGLRMSKRRPSGILVGTHATLAVSGFVILVAYFFSG